MVALIVHLVVVLHFNMWINNNDKSTIIFLNGQVHLFDQIRFKPLLVVLEVHVVPGVVNVHPQDVNLEVMFCELVIPFLQSCSIDVGPLTEMETQAVSRG